MFYKFLRWVVRIILEIYFRKIYIHGLEKVPEGKPLLLAANHPSAFLEACILACYVKRPLHFLVRGDVFVSKFLWFFKATNQVPIYRFRDGYNSLKKNASTFQYCYDTLADGKAILVFPEGNTEPEKRLRPIQKGTARIAFGTMDSHGDIGLSILPVGVNYTHPTQFRKDVMVTFGNAIDIDSHYENYKEDKVKAIQALTKEIEEALFEKVVHIEEADEEVLEKLFILGRSELESPYSPIVIKSKIKFDKEKNIADQYLKLNDEKKKIVSTLVNEYFQSLKKEEVEDHFLVDNKQSSTHNFGNLLILILGFPFALVGIVLNGLPAYISNQVAKAKVSLMEFFDPVRIGVALLIYLILFALIIILALFNKYFWLLFIAIPIFGYFSLWYWEIYNRWSDAKLRKKSSQKDIEALRKLRAKINTEFPYI